MKENIVGSFYKDVVTKKPIEVRGNLVEQFDSNGREGEIGFYQIDIVGEKGSRQISGTYCIKKIEQRIINKYPESDVDEVLKKYIALKKIGLPTLPLMRCNSEQNSILMSHIQDSENEVIFDNHLPKPFGLKINNLDEIINLAYRSGSKAYKNNLLLDNDAYAIIFNNKTNYGRLCFIDIGRNTKFVKYNLYPISAFEQVEMFVDNVALRH